jgi:hypothetical protein
VLSLSLIETWSFEYVSEMRDGNKFRVWKVKWVDEGVKEFKDRGNEMTRVAIEGANLLYFFTSCFKLNEI